MKFSSGTCEKLIGLVREESALYDASLQGYKDHICKKNYLERNIERNENEECEPL